MRPDRVNTLEPRPKVGSPRPSRDLPDDVRREYDKLTRRLAPLRVATLVDGLAQELAALALAEVWRHEAVLRQHGSTYATTTPQGSTMTRQRPEVAMAADAWRRAKAMLEQFGLTPASRSKVEAVPPDHARSKWFGLIGDAPASSTSVEAFRRRRPATGAAFRRDPA